MSELIVQNKIPILVALAGTALFLMGLYMAEAKIDVNIETGNVYSTDGYPLPFLTMFLCFGCLALGIVTGFVRIPKLKTSDATLPR